MSLGKKPYHKQMAEGLQQNKAGRWWEDPSRPPPTTFGLRGKRKAKAQFGRRESRQEDPGKDPETVLKDAVAAKKGRPTRIRFRRRADITLSLPTPIDSWGNYFGEMIRSMTFSTYNLEPHMRSERWPRIEGYIQAQFGKSYNTNKATLKREHWIRDPETELMIWTDQAGKPDEFTMKTKWTSPTKRTKEDRQGRRTIVSTTVNGVFQDPEAPFRMDRMRELEANGEAHHLAEITAMVSQAVVAGVAARDREDGEIRGLMMVAMTEQIFSGKKSGNAVVQAVYKKNCRLFPSDMSLGKIPLKEQRLIEAKR
ncbi:hypothetical protein Tco_0368769 [Tanacetum coccineum]